MATNQRTLAEKWKKLGLNFQSYRYTFLGSDHEQIVAAVELFIASEDAACRLASDLLDKSPAAFVEIWSDGRLVMSVAKPPRQPH